MEITNTHYIKNKIKYDRVTKVLSIIHDYGFENMCRNLGYQYVDAAFKLAAERGTFFHKAMKLVADGVFNGLIEESMKENEMYDDIKIGQKWFEDNVKEIICAEKTFFSKLKFAGTVDLIAKLKDDKIYIIDYKTGSIINRKHELQLAAYTSLAEKELKIKINKRMILQINDNKLKQIIIKSDKSIDVNYFFYALTLYREFT